MKVTLLDNTIVDIDPDTVKEVSQNMGSANPVSERCGLVPFLGLMLCPECKAINNTEGCDKWFVVFVEKGEPEPIEIHLKDGEILYAKEFERPETGKQN